MIFIGSHLKDYFNMSDQSFDIVVIGGGVGGYTAALKARDLGASVALVESNLIGGTCLNVGCIPTKALLESSKILRTARKAGEFGIGIEGVSPSPQVMVERSKSVVAVLRKGVEDLLSQKGIHVVRGTAKLASPTRVHVDADGKGIDFEMKSIIIATGSSWLTLPGVKIDGKRIITSDHALDLPDVDGSTVIVGGGAIGCEFAEIYSALGSQVTIVEMMHQILPGEDSELAKRLEAALKRKGIRVLTRSKVAGIDDSKGRLTVQIEEGEALEADRVLVGIGRRPNTKDLGLEDLGIELDRHAIKTDAGMRTNIPEIFAVGDVTGKYLLAHVALAQGVVAGENACGRNSEMDYAAVPRCVYTDPESAAVGLTEAEAANQGLDVSVYRVRLGRIGRALTLGETFGLAKVVYDKLDGKIVGFHALAPHASELLPEVTLAICRGMTVRDIAQVIHPHPTLSEIIWECADGAAGDLARQT